MIRITYSTGEIREYVSTINAAMEATELIVASQGLIVPVEAMELLEHGVELKLKVTLGLVGLIREV